MYHLCKTVILQNAQKKYLKFMNLTLLIINVYLCGHRTPSQR